MMWRTLPRSGMLRRYRPPGFPLSMATPCRPLTLYRARFISPQNPSGGPDAVACDRPGCNWRDRARWVCLRDSGTGLLQQHCEDGGGILLLTPTLAIIHNNGRASDKPQDRCQLDFSSGVAIFRRTRFQGRVTSEDGKKGKNQN